MSKETHRHPTRYVTTVAGLPARDANAAEQAHARRLKHYIFNQPPLTSEEVIDTMAKRIHKATYSTDKRSGGYLVRVAGPSAERFINRSVPVTLKNGSEHEEKLIKLVWVGADQETGEKVALYKFEAKPRIEESIDF